MKHMSYVSQRTRANGFFLESNDGEFGSFRLGGQLEMVYAHEYNLVPK
jgi:hypothetical protein